MVHLRVQENEPRSIQLFREQMKQQAKARANMYLKAQRLSYEQAQESEELSQEVCVTPKGAPTVIKHVDATCHAADR